MNDIKWQDASGGPMAKEQTSEVLIFDRALTASEIVKLAEPEQVVAEIKAEISKRIAALPKADFNAAAEVVGAVLNEYIDRGVLLDDEHALTDAVADVLDGVTG